jgi:peroxisomal enoyl-CoA hydratase 2
VAVYLPEALLHGDGPGAWSAPVPITYDQRDVLLYAVGIGCSDLRFTYEGHPQFAVFPSFAIRWGSAGLQIDRTAVPSSPGPLMIDAERCIEQLAPLPVPVGIGADKATTVQVRSRLLAVHPRGKGGAFTEFETEVLDGAGTQCMRITTGLFQRGVAALGDIAPFEGAASARSVKLPSLPQRPADVTASPHRRQPGLRCTGCRATTTRCTSTPIRRSSAASRRPSCTACAPTAIARSC